MSDITRRDILHGLATLPLSGVVGGLHEAPPFRADSKRDYPPGKTGLRGSHAGSYETAHALARDGQRDFGPLASSGATYDLVVVGAGISGLAAAYFYRQQQPEARILILDNHDDFGGHAKRNEFTINGRGLIGYGGSQSLESPSEYSDVAKALLRDLSVDVDAFDDAYDHDFYTRQGLRGGLFFDRETYGRSAFVDANLIATSDFLGLAPSRTPSHQAVSQMPISAEDQASLRQLLLNTEDAVPNISLGDLPEFLSGISYLDFLRDHLGVKSQALVKLLSPLPSGYFGIGIDGIPAIDALVMGMPGGRQLGVPGVDWLRGLLGGLADPYIHHFPDGNASIARLLVRTLIPQISGRAKPQELLTDHIDYALLDRPENNVALRLSSTVVNVSHEGSGAQVSYVKGGKHYQVAANHCVMACYNMMIPYLCPDMPAKQKAALSELVKIPLVYTNVALKNWHALKNLGIGQAFSPNMFHQMMMVDFPVSMGGYDFANDPSEPILLHMSSSFGAPGLAPKDQFRVGRAKLLGTSFAEIESDTRNHLDQLLGEGGFHSERDIAAITVNRWPHGYAYGSNTLFDPHYPAGQAPHELGRKNWGPVAIANSDAGARAYLDEAIDQAYRAVSSWY